MWAGVGAVIGFFAGERLGHRKGVREAQEMINQRLDEIDEEEILEASEADKAINEYRAGFDYDGDKYDNLQTVEGLKQILKGKGIQPATEEDAEMPTETPVIDDDPRVVPQLHPTQILPKIVSEEEFYKNPWEFEEEKLLFYELDEVLYNTTTQTIVEYPDNVLGVGTLFEFHVGPGPAKDTIYVINELFGTRFRVDRIDDAFQDCVDGGVHPEDDEPEPVEPNGEDPERESDEYWDDV
jgi:hypothetical protein